MHGAEQVALQRARSTASHLGKGGDGEGNGISAFGPLSLRHAIFKRARPSLRDQKRLPVRLFDPVISHLISIVLCDADRSSSVAAGGRSASGKSDIQ